MRQEKYSEIINDRLTSGLGGRFYGVYPALVTNVIDPDGQGRVKVKLPWSLDNEGSAYEAWARLATFMAGNNRGSWFIPDVDDEVLISFEAGDPRRPYVIGGLWNGQDQTPQTMDNAGKNFIKKLRSRNGVQITLDDKDGQETLILETPGGQVVTLKDGPGSIEMKDSNGNYIKMGVDGITIYSPAKITINTAGPSAEIIAPVLNVNVNGSNFSGVINAPTVISSSIVGATYTPGAGNIW